MNKAMAAAMTIGLAAATSVVLVTPAHATTSCKATLSVAHPKDNSYETLTVHTTKSAKTYANIHYKSTTTVRSTIASAAGVGTIRFDISRATYGYRVVVDVTTNSHQVCSAAFTPEK